MSPVILKSFQTGHHTNHLHHDSNPVHYTSMTHKNYFYPVGYGDGYGYGYGYGFGDGNGYGDGDGYGGGYGDGYGTITTKTRRT